ncbi:TetR/AcrR family transcriptional regulator [Flexivirga sp. ID2601S]|uniref:TetR/AcrR family transcriptional regulator n=1 Tax=Flexivirga aerilata TaxID=1656889 RepID=A0A849AKR9_9MICO|nr:TetR/AcrR family transcriptional regulator [Flexivirga aerilata]NNG38990.1 TetR/AcrR family transcriptional regulator [Flexivirga aerilata]
MSEEVGGSSVFDRPEPTERPAPVPLSRELIVSAAVALADEEGLEAVSFRKVAAALGAGPMRLYRYVDTKDELLDLMVDHVYGELSGQPAPTGDWRAQLTGLADDLRGAMHRHPWCADLLGGRPHLGPHAVAYLERGLAGLAPAFGDDIVGMTTARAAVTAYALGQVRTELAGAADQDDRTWQAASIGGLRDRIASGDYPMLSRIVHESGPVEPDQRFAAGLRLLLDGVAIRLSRD